MASLQPYIVFKSEATRLNSLYWTSKYAYSRVTGLLNLMRETGTHAADPRVDQLWGSVELGQSSIATRPLSEFVLTLDENAEALRTTSILHMCSAFENALCGYFFLCALYQPLGLNSSYSGMAIPQLLHVNADYERRKLEIKRLCDSSLHGKYTKRLQAITNGWNLPSLTTGAISRLDGYYDKRHLIAHDQALDDPDSPESSAEEIIKSKINIDESTWKSMIADFIEVLVELDQNVIAGVVTDGGMALAIYKIVLRDGPQEIKDLKRILIDEWRTGTMKESTVRSISLAIGMKITQVNGNRYKVSR